MSRTDNAAAYPPCPECTAKASIPAARPHPPVRIAPVARFATPAAPVVEHPGENSQATRVLRRAGFRDSFVRSQS